MDSRMIIEIVGYVGSILVVVSMLMTSVVKLRIINTTGSLIFATYALIIHSYPTALMNLALVIINLYNTWKLFNVEKNFHLIKTQNDSPFVDFITEKYLDDIKKYFPKFESTIPGKVIYLISCEDTPAGLLVGEINDGHMQVTLDYTMPTYRDCSVGKFLYNELKKEGIKTLTIDDPTDEHQQYMEKMGFERQGNKYIKKI